jgi:hypothetical protein
MRQAHAAAIHATTEARPRGRERFPLAGAIFEVVDTREVDQDFEFQGGIVAQRQADLLQAGGLDFVTELIGQRWHALRKPRQAGFDGGCQCGNFFGSGNHALAMVLVRSIFFCSWMMP